MAVMAAPDLQSSALLLAFDHRPVAIRHRRTIRKPPARIPANSL
jgi:hypothetical protein